MSKIEDELITKECFAMQDIILETFVRQAKWLNTQMDIIKYLQDRNINLVSDYDQQIAELKAEYKEAEQCAIDFQNKNIELETEIEELKNHMELMRENYQQQLKDNTKRVCEKIRNGYPNFDNLDKFDWQGFEEFLDQIENNKKESN